MTIYVCETGYHLSLTLFTLDSDKKNLLIVDTSRIVVKQFVDQIKKFFPMYFELIIEINLQNGEKRRFLTNKYIYKSYHLFRSVIEMNRCTRVLKLLNQPCDEIIIFTPNYFERMLIKFMKSLNSNTIINILEDGIGSYIIKPTFQSVFQIKKKSALPSYILSKVFNFDVSIDMINSFQFLDTRLVIYSDLKIDQKITNLNINRKNQNLIVDVFKKNLIKEINNEKSENFVYFSDYSESNVKFKSISVKFKVTPYFKRHPDKIVYHSNKLIDIIPWEIYQFLYDDPLIILSEASTASYTPILLNNNRLHMSYILDFKINSNNAKNNSFITSFYARLNDLYNGLVDHCEITEENYD